MQAVPIRGSQCKGPEAATSKLGQPNGQKEGRSGGGRETRRRVREREVRENVGLGEIPGQNASAPAGWPRPLDFLISLRQEELAADKVLGVFQRPFPPPQTHIRPHFSLP